MGSLRKWFEVDKNLVKAGKWLGLSGSLAMVTTWVQIPASALRPTFWAALAVFDRSLTSGSSAGATLNRLPPISIVTLRSCDRTAATGV